MLDRFRHLLDYVKELDDAKARPESAGSVNSSNTKLPSVGRSISVRESRSLTRVSEREETVSPTQVAGKDLPVGNNSNGSSSRPSSTANNTPRASRQPAINFRQQSVPSESLNSARRLPFNNALLAAGLRQQFADVNTRKENVIVPSKNEQYMLDTLISPDNKSQTLPANLTPSQVFESAKTASSVQSGISSGSSDVSSDSDTGTEPGTPGVLRKLGAILKTKEGVGETTGSIRSVSSSVSGRDQIEMVTDNEAPSGDERDQSREQKHDDGVVRKRGKAALNGEKDEDDVAAIDKMAASLEKSNGLVPPLPGNDKTLLSAQASMTSSASAEPQSLSLSTSSERSHTKGDDTLSLSSPALTMSMTSTQYGRVTANKVADDVHQVNHQSTSYSRDVDHQHHDSHSSSSSSSSSSDSDEKHSKQNKSKSDKNEKRKKNHQQIVREHAVILDNTPDSIVSVDNVNKSKSTNSVNDSHEKVVKLENTMTKSAMNGHVKPHAKSRKSKINVVNGAHSNGQAVHLNPDETDVYSTDSPAVAKPSNSKRPLSSQVIIENSKNKIKLEESVSTEIVRVIETTEISYHIPAKGFLEENVVENTTNGIEDGKKGIGTQLDMIEEKYLEGILEDDSTESSDDESHAKRHDAVTIATAALHTDTDKVKVTDVNLDEYYLIHEPMNMESSEVHYYLSGLYFAETVPPAPANENVVRIKSANGEGCLMLHEPSITENVETFALLPGRYFVESLIENLDRPNDNPKLDKQLTVVSGEGCIILPPVIECVETIYFLPELCFMEVSKTKPTKADDEIVRMETINGESCQIISAEHVQVIGHLPEKLFVEELDVAESPPEEIQVTPRRVETLSSAALRVTYAPEIDKEDNYFPADTALSPPPMFSDNLATSADNFALSNLPKRTSTSTTLDDVDGNSSSSDFPSSLGRSDSAYSDHITLAHSDHVTLARPLLQPVLAEETEFMPASPRSRSASIAESSETVYYMPARIVTVTQDAQTTLRHKSSSSSSSTSESDNEESSGKMLGLLPPVLFADDAVVEQVEIEHSLEGRYFRELRRPRNSSHEERVSVSESVSKHQRRRKSSAEIQGPELRDDLMLDYTYGTEKVTSTIQHEEVVVLEGKLMNEIITTRDLDSDYQIHEEESVQLYQKQEVSAAIQPTDSSAVNHGRASVTSRDSVTNEHIEYIADDKVFNDVAVKAPARRKKLLKKRKVSQDLSKQQTQQKSYKRTKDTSGSSSSDSDVARAKERPSSVSDDVMLLYLLAEQRGMKWEVIDQLHKTKPAPASEHVERDAVALATAAAATTASMLGSVANHDADEVDNATLFIEEQNTDVLNAKVIVIRQQTNEVTPALLREETVEQLESRTFAQRDNRVKYVVATEMAAISAEHLQPDPELVVEPEPKPVVVVTVVDILEGRCVVQTETTVNDLAEKVVVGAVTVATAKNVHVPEVEAVPIQMTVIDDLEARSLVQTETCVDELPGKTTVAMETLESVSSDVEPVVPAVVTTVVIVDDLEGRTVVQEDTCVDDKLLLASAVTLAAASPHSDESDTYTYDTSLTPIVTVVDDLQERTIAQTEYTVEDLPDKLGAGAVIMRADLNMENEDEDGVDVDNVVVAGAAGLAVYHNELIHISEDEVIEGESDVFFTREEEEEAAAAALLVQQEELERYFNTEVTSDSGVVVASSVAVAEANGRPKSYSAGSSKKLHLSSESERESLVDELPAVQKTAVDNSPRHPRPAAVEALRSQNTTSGSQESLASVYSQAGRGAGHAVVTGDVELGVSYDYKTGCLLVHVRQCRHLAYADSKKKRTDPYVKTYLLPDKTKNGKRRTKARKNTTDPIFNEKLKYEVNRSVLDSRVLWVSVWHSEQFGRNEFLGEVNLSLIDCNFDTEVLRWYKLQPKPYVEEEHSMPVSMLSYKGDLHVSLKFACSEGLPSLLSPGELHVVIHEARNLAAVRVNSTSNPFCKGYLLPDKSRTAQQNTPVVKRDCNPKWQHEFVFRDVSLTQLYERCLELTIWDHGTTNDFLGGVRIGLGPGKSRLKDAADWMDSWGDEVQLWQAMLDRANCWIEGTLLLRPHMDRRK